MRLKGKTGAIFPREEHILPYKDLEKRRKYDREYKRPLWGQRGLTNSGQTPVRKAYICLKVLQTVTAAFPFAMAGL